MSSVLPCLSHEISFDADSLACMGEAFDQACAKLKADWQPADFKEALAAHIIAMARTGKHDPDWLCDEAAMRWQQASGLRLR